MNQHKLFESYFTFNLVCLQSSYITMSTTWGEIPNVHDTDSGIAALEREQMTKPRPTDVEGPPLHQPSQLDSTASAQ